MQCKHLLPCPFIFACTKQPVISFSMICTICNKQKQHMYCSWDPFCFIYSYFDWHIGLFKEYDPVGTSYAVSISFKCSCVFFFSPKAKQEGTICSKKNSPIIIIICITFCFPLKQGPVSWSRITAEKQLFTSVPDVRGCWVLLYTWVQYSCFWRKTPDVGIPWPRFFLILTYQGISLISYW